MAFEIALNGPAPLRTFYVKDIEAMLKSVDVASMRFLQASGEELDHIQYQFSYGDMQRVTIPFSRQKVQRWYGDLAKTIFCSL